MFLLAPIVPVLEILALTAVSQPQRNITGKAIPYVVPADIRANSTFTVIVRGTNFGTPQSQPSDLKCRVKVPEWEAPFPDATGPATVLNETTIACKLNGYSTAGMYGIAVESASHSDPAKHVWWSHGTAPVHYRNFIEATPNRRPYMSDDILSAKLLLAINHGAIDLFPTSANAQNVTICAHLVAQDFNPYLPKDRVLDPSLDGLALLPCKTFPLSNMAGGADLGRDGPRDGLYNTTIFSIPFDQAALAKLPSSVVAANLNITTSIDTLELAPKYRRFAVAPSASIVSGQSTSVVCHQRRMIRVNDQPWVGVGFYASHFLVGAVPRGAPPQLTLEAGKKVLAEMAREGMTQIMPYDLAVLNATDRAEIIDFMDNDLNASLKFDLLLVPEAEKLMNSTVGSANYTEAWTAIQAKVKSVMHSRSLLGYYICDDCDNAASFPRHKMSQLYVALKALDPFHVVIGAPWARPWSLYQYGDDSGALGLDYLQVENYVPEPAYHPGFDERMRAGMFWEPIANSPPMYILSGFTADGKNETEPWPAVLESTLSWLGAIEYGAVNSVNFVIESNRAPNSHRKVIDRPDHINAQGNYARAARKLLPALLPDLTDGVEGPLDVHVIRASACLSPASLPAYNGRPAVDLAQNNAVVARGYRQRWIDPITKHDTYCAFILVVNLCGAPTSFELGFDVPQDIDHARHQFDAAYTVMLRHGDEDTLSDIAPGYATSVLRLGCPGFTESCDGTQRVC